MKDRSWQSFAIADFALHQEVILFSGHTRLQEQYKIIEQQIRLYIVSCNSLHPSLEELMADRERKGKALLQKIS